MDKRLERLQEILQEQAEEIKALASELPTDADCWGCNCPKMERMTAKWIPCSERLPEVNGRYLCANDQWGAWRVDINMWVNGHWRNQIEKPIAWQPLPEPYKEDM